MVIALLAALAVGGVHLVGMTDTMSGSAASDNDPVPES